MRFCDHCGNPVYQDLPHACPNGVRICLTGWPKPPLPPRQRKDEEMMETGVKLCDHCQEAIYPNLMHICPDMHGLLIETDGSVSITFEGVLECRPAIPNPARAHEKSGAFDWRNHYGGESSDDRRLKVGRNVEMSDIGTTTTTTWPCATAWVGLREPLSLFVISIEDGTELLVSAHRFDEAWRIASARIAKQAMHQTGARAVEMPILPENITWIPLPTQPQLLHVFEKE